jgi:NADH dehydrogenase
LQFSGRVGWLLWLVVHLAFLTGFKNRVTTVVHWAITFIGRARAERTISAVHAATGRREQPPG